MAVVRAPSVVLDSPIQAETRPVHARGVALALGILFFAFHVHRPGVIPGRDVKESGARAIGRGIPIGRALIAGGDPCALECGFLTRYAQRTAVAVETAHP